MLKNRFTSMALAASLFLGVCGTATSAFALDRVTLKDGSTLEGTVTREVAGYVWIKVKGADGKETERMLAPGEFTKVEKNVTESAPAAPAAPATGTVPVNPTPADAAKAGIDTKGTGPVDTAGKTKYYWITLSGDFGTDISETPIRNALKDAKEQGAEVIIFEMNAAWNPRAGEALADLDPSNIDEVFRAEPMTRVLTEEMRREWGGNPPKTVFWVKQAMSGAAFLPLVCKDIYFHSEGRLGGLGGLTLMFQGMGDEVVVAKQLSLRLGHAEGLAAAGGYNPDLVRAMTRYEYVMSMRFVNGKAELFEGYPKTPDEELLTDDGMGINADGMEDRVAGRGNDVLTFNARIANAVGLSKGTADTKDELLHILGLERGGVAVDAKSKRLMDSWKDGLDRAQSRLRKLREDYGEVRVEAPGDYSARTKARGQRRRILEEMKQIQGQWGEGLSARFLAQNGIPPVPQIEIALEGIRIDQMGDQREPR